MGKRKLTRKQIKKADPVTEFLDDMVDFYKENQKLVLFGIAGIILLVAVVTIGTTFYKNYQKKKSIAMYKALKNVDGVVNKDGKSVLPGQKVFKTKKEKYEAILKGFEKVYNDYSSSDAGKIAVYFMADALYHLGKDKEALKEMSRFNLDCDTPIGSFYNFQMAELYRAMGKYQKALDIYNKLLQNPVDVPEDSIRYSKILCFRGMGKEKQEYLALKKFNEDLIKESQETGQSSYYLSLIRVRYGILSALYGKKY